MTRLLAKSFLTALFLVAAVGFFAPTNFVQAANLLFRTGFEANSGPLNTAIPQYGTFTGTDNSVGLPNNWSSLSSFKLDYVCGNAADRWAKIVDDPTRAGNRIMKFWLNRAVMCDAASRVQTSLSSGGTDKERFSRVRMYLHPDMLKLIGYQGDKGFMFEEFWIRPNWTGAPNSFRMSFRLVRGVVGGTEKYFWVIDSQECCAGMPGQDGTEFWKAENKTVPVPVGEWFTAETYYKMGDANNGRIIFSIQRDGQPKQTVADITNWTYHPEVGPQGIYMWSPHKVYTSTDVTDYVRSQGGTLQIYWDDWELWDGIPSGNPVPTCSSFTYSVWSACQNNIQTRTITSSTPSGCTGGNPITSQSCTPPATCGDNSCGSGETCSTCAQDCGTCPPTTRKYTITDFTNLVTDWLKSLPGSPADVNLDGKVNSRDLGIMMSGWSYN